MFASFHSYISPQGLILVIASLASGADKLAHADPYASERGEPTRPACTVHLTFHGQQLSVQGASTVNYPAFSGTPVDGEFDNSPERQKVRNEGPIPAGRYWIDPEELDDNWHYRWHKKAWESWGRYRITLHPYTDTETYGRGGFFIHGGKTPGSAGCIDLTSEMDKFAALLKRHRRCHIVLTVEYADSTGAGDVSEGDPVVGGGQGLSPIHVHRPPGWGVE
ncbi:MAG TPA: DUF2778 domain-containing protein [Lacipirellulaceae bacterium]|nr:DUF2778 domain-containing protein [Lacipirellulaceae bacterium]